jgi:hypothetical protein
MKTKRKTYGGRSQTVRRSRRSTRRKILWFISFVILAWVTCNPLRASLQQLSDKLAAAEASYRTSIVATTIPAQVAKLDQASQQTQFFSILEEKDWSWDTRFEQQDAQSAAGQMRESFNSLSDLIDGLLIVPTNVKERRDETRADLDDVERYSLDQAYRVQAGKEDFIPFLDAAWACMETSAERIQILGLGNLAIATAEKQRAVIERLRFLLNCLSCIFGVLTVAPTWNGKVKQLHRA